MTQEAKSRQSVPSDTSAEHARASPPTLLVVGAGPKAVAIAAKRYMLAKLGYRLSQCEPLLQEQSGLPLLEK